MASDWITRNRGYLAGAITAVLASFALSAVGVATPLPALGTLPLLPTVVLAAVIGFPLLLALQNKGVTPRMATRVNVLRLFALGAALALPPIAIDLGLRFPLDINLPLPKALLFYPAVALVAEVVFHLGPLALLAWLIPRGVPRIWVLTPVIFVEPVFQVTFSSDLGWGAALVFVNVLLVSTAQLYLFQRYGFGAMFALRLVYYLFWHVIWGTIRVSLLF